ncbi:MAG: Rdx family protein [Acidobacteria bacterium]|nr:Rdx family protein [Acidobacteriota bacterium]
MSAVSDLLSNYQHIIDELTLVTGSKGVFDVVVDDETLYSKGVSGRHANDGEILELFTELVGADTPRYGD